ncbi:hypothetical protein GQF01_13055 [Paenibacillus sp. 5J-6]|uniref:Intracellular proteinase inhibitor BsuPI domain-containing protein n=1 Tax=Paenibacillus silvestris TaxID=2606219 RepID=A0A6L8UY69_9BACL|nr:hypothetical protein [Paenibacillus silvestris]MZQ83035.1 hypothetical protein [Paenibacillus silvestris]
MTKINNRNIMIVLVMFLIFAGCTKSNTEQERNLSQSDLVGSIKVESLGIDTKITYTFKNQSEKKVTVIGGARYKLLKDNKEVDVGTVPIKDYLDLEPGQDYTDRKTFSNLEPGSYTVHVEWNKTIVSAEFVQN